MLDNGGLRTTLRSGSTEEVGTVETVVVKTVVVETVVAETVLVYVVALEIVAMKGFVDTFLSARGGLGGDV